MNKLTNEEIATVFAMYWGQDVVTHIETENPLGSPVRNALALLVMGMFKIENHRLILTHLSDINDNHATGIRILCDSTYDKSIENIKEWARIYAAGNYSMYQYLIQQGYAVPLFFGLNHWANGKTAIELGIAIERRTVHTA